MSVPGLHGVILGHLGQAGAEWVQIDEPILVTDLSEQQRRTFTRAYARARALGAEADARHLVSADSRTISLRHGAAGRRPACRSGRAPDQLDPVLGRLRPRGCSCRSA